MSVHASLRSKKGAGILRAVLKRHERVRALLSKGDWQEGRSAFGLPKMKQVKVKVRRAEEKPKDEATSTAAPAEGAIEKRPAASS